jgi:hypothetical protein
MGEVTGIRAFVAALAGAASAVLAWLLVVPWDLSEVTEDGRPIEGGGDDSGLQIGLVGVVVVGLGLVAVARPSTRALAAMFVAGGLGTWTVLFGWRAGVSETVGANMFMVPLVTVCLPATIVTPIVIRAIATRLDGRDGLARA